MEAKILEVRVIERKTNRILTLLLTEQQKMDIYFGINKDYQLLS